MFLLLLVFDMSMFFLFALNTKTNSNKIKNTKSNEKTKHHTTKQQTRKKHKQKKRKLCIYLFIYWFIYSNTWLIIKHTLDRAHARTWLVDTLPTPPIFTGDAVWLNALVGGTFTPHNCAGFGALILIGLVPLHLAYSFLMLVVLGNTNGTIRNPDKTVAPPLPVHHTL